jgi:hypothetical protein
MKRDDFHTYMIQIRGQLQEADIASISPPELFIEQRPDDRTLLTIIADQSMLVGLIRHLHGLGFVLISVISCEEV